MDLYDSLCGHISYPIGDESSHDDRVQREMEKINLEERKSAIEVKQIFIVISSFHQQYQLEEIAVWTVTIREKVSPVGEMTLGNETLRDRSHYTLISSGQFDFFE